MIMEELLKEMIEKINVMEERQKRMEQNQEILLSEIQRLANLQNMGKSDLSDMTTDDALDLILQDHKKRKEEAEGQRILDQI